MRDGIVATTVNPFAPSWAAVAFEMAAGNHARALEIVDDARAALDAVDNPYAQACVPRRDRDLRGHGRTDRARHAPTPNGHSSWHAASRNVAC